MIINVRMHYLVADPGCEGDYTDVEVRITGPEGVFILSYGDYYHDKGDVKVAGIIDILRKIFGTVRVYRTDVADRDDNGV